MWRIEHPFILSGLVLVAGVVWLWVRYQRWRIQARNALLSPARQKELFAPSYLTQRYGNILIVLLGLLVLTAADLRIGQGFSETSTHDSVVMIALDLSTSMLAEDTRPSRSAYAKRLLGQWISQAPAQTRIGLMSFAASTQVETPPTLDREYVLSRLALLEPEQIMEQGTDLTLCIRNATKLLASQESTPLLILVTDAEDHSQKTMEALKKATEAGIAILPIGVGTSQGAPVPSGDSNSAYLKDEQGNLVRSARNDAMLQALGENGGTNTWLIADGDQDIVSKINQVRDEFARGVLHMYRSKDYLPQYKWFLVPAIAILFLLIWKQRNQ